MIILGCLDVEDHAVAVRRSEVAERWSGMLEELLGRVAGSAARGMMIDRALGAEPARWAAADELPR